MSSFTFVVIATLEPGDGVTIRDPVDMVMEVLADGSLMIGGVLKGHVGKVVVWSPREEPDAGTVAVGPKTGAVFAPGKTDGKWWEWNGAKWVVIDPLRALPGLLV